MPTIIGRLTGAAFQTELLIMNLLGLVNSLRKWELGWSNQVDAISSSENLSEVVKTILCWVVILRIIIANIYTITYLANFYSILTWCRGRTLFPWMILSAFDNFLLEFISFTITLLLWLENSISSALFSEYVIARAIPRVPAFYYWCIINLFRADLQENQRRKLTLARRGAQRTGSRISELAVDHMLFAGVSYGKDYFEKLPRFASLTNLDDFSLKSSSFKYDNEQDYYKRSKSLVTFFSIDSDESDELEEYLALYVFDDDSLTPVEKAMKILNLNADDIAKARLRLGGNVLPASSAVEEFNDNVSTIEQSTAIVISKNPECIISSESITDVVQAGKIEKKTLNEENMPKTRTSRENTQKLAASSESNDENKVFENKIRSQEDLEISSANFPFDCICGESSKKSMSSTVSESSDELEEPSNNNLHTYVNDDQNFSGDHDWRNTQLSLTENKKTQLRLNASTKFSTSDPSALTKESAQFPELSTSHKTAVPLTVQMSGRPLANNQLRPDSFKDQTLTTNLACREDLQKHNYTLLGLSNMELEPSEHFPKESCSNGIRDSQEDRNHENIRHVYIQTNFNKDADYSNDLDLAGFLITNSNFTSKSAQTKISGDWKTDKSLEVSIDKKMSENTKHRSKSKRPNPLSRIHETFDQFSSIMRNPENIDIHTAREMRALRVYNEFTLREDKREMEAKKEKSAFTKCAYLQDATYTSNLTNPPMQDLHKLAGPSPSEETNPAKLQDQFNQVQRWQAHSIPQEKTFKLNALRIKLDALETSILLAFTNDKKTRKSRKDSKFKQQKTEPGSITGRTNPRVRQETSKYGKRMRFQDDRIVTLQSATGIDDLYENDDRGEAHEIKNVVSNNQTATTNVAGLNNVFSETISPLRKNSDIQDKSYTIKYSPTKTIKRHEQHGLSKIREVLTSLNWNFVNPVTDKDSSLPRHGSTVLNRERFLWDILDDTDTLTLLQSAFSSNLKNPTRGFHLGPGPGELYSFSNFFDGVIEEIIKATGLSYRSDAFRHEPTAEVDINYLEDFEVMSLPMIEDSSEDWFPNSDTETEDAVHDEIVSRRPVETSCRHSYSTERLRTGPYRKIAKNDIRKNDPADEEYSFWQTDCKTYSIEKREGNRISAILGERELTHLEYWTKELRNLASYDHHADHYEIANRIQHMTNLPGFCVVKMIVDFFRNFTAVSKSTTTSQTFLNGDGSIRPFSSDNEEIFARKLSKTRSELIANENSNIPESSHTSSNAVNDAGQFYFGRLDNDRLPFFDMLTAMSEPHNCQLHIDVNSSEENSKKAAVEIVPEEIQACPPINQLFARPNNSSDSGNLEVPPNIKNSSQYRIDEVSRQDTQQPLNVDTTIDSYDSLYSGLSSSKYSDNVVSISGRSSMEEFSSNLLNSTGSQH